MRIALSGSTRQVVYRNLSIARYNGDLKFALRLETILLLSENWFPEKVAKFTQHSLKSIYNWRNRFIANRVDGLKSKKSFGRKAKLNKSQKKELKEMILKSPSEFGFACGVWTCSMIQTLIFKKFAVEYSLGYISQLLAQLGLSHKKVEAVSHKADIEQQRVWKEETFPSIIAKAIRQKASILFQDESTFRQWSRMSHSWGEKGEKITARVNMTGTYQKVFGAIDLLNRKLIWRFSAKINQASFLDYLKYLLTKYSGQKIFLILDNGPAHHGLPLNKFLVENREKIELCYLPKYSPILNPIEILWREVKHNFMNGKYFETKKAFLSTLRGALKRFQIDFMAIMSVMGEWINTFHKVRKALFTKRAAFRLLKKVMR